MADNYMIFTIFMAFVTGAALGSFVSMASYRLPHGSDIVFKPSYCPNCNTALKCVDLFPLLSWLIQKGRCRYCRNPISIRYPVIEATLGSIFALLVYNYGLTSDAFFFCLLATELAILIVTDLEHYIIPDSMQIALFITGLAYRIYNADDMLEVFVSAAVGLAIGLTLHYGYLWFRKKDALGWGDVKFFIVVGIWLPLSAFVPFFFFAGVIGTITGLLWQYKGRGAIFPFGPAIALSLFINVLFPDLLSMLQR
jgi:leader peptidase (prepilin peptidase)/N-methyltransferase